MSSAIEYRVAGIEDVFDIARLTSDTMLECGLGSAAFDLLLTRWEGYVRGVRHPQHALQPCVLFAAFCDREMAGYIAGHFSERYSSDGELQSVYVRKSYHKRGIGTALLERLAGWFVAHNRRSVCVGIDPNNPYKRFYEKHGARYLNEHWLIWDDIGAVLESIRSA